MRIMVVTCENGDRYSTELEDGDTIRITKAGNVRLSAPDGLDDVAKLESPAVSIHEMVPHGVAEGERKSTWIEAEEKALAQMRAMINTEQI